MAAVTIQASSKLIPLGLSTSSSCNRRGSIIRATLNAPKIATTGLMEELNIRGDYKIATTQLDRVSLNSLINATMTGSPDPMVTAKLYEILEVLADRVEMHKSIGEQRNNWNHLFLTSINAITLTAATMCGLAVVTANGAPLAAFKISSSMLYLAATGMLAIMNKIQPSQLVEEQRNAARLFKQLHSQIQTLVSIGNPTVRDVNEAMERILALDRAYPLPLLGSMVEKFPSRVEPAVWWPQQKGKQAKGVGNGRTRKIEANGWNSELEDEMRQIIRVLKRKDEADYLRLGKKALEINKVLAISGPLLTCLGAVGSAFVGTSNNTWAVIVGVVAGAMASIVNAMEHGGQVGMVFEMYRSNAGFFKLMEETIESNINETNVWGRENGQVLRMKVALQLGRSLSDLKNLSSYSSSRTEDTQEEFASKLF